MLMIPVFPIEVFEDRGHGAYEGQLLGLLGFRELLVPLVLARGPCLFVYHTRSVTRNGTTIYLTYSA